jgi:tRNA pseudouridine32 synthase / 23S rRNA pseudouridine746 synthase
MTTCYTNPMTATRNLTESEMLARVLYRDAMMLVIDKPAGIAVHATGHDKLALDQSFYHLQYGLPKRPELAHRLDRGTSGCLVLGRHRQALIKLGKLFENKKIEKTYLAIVVGTPAEPEGIINQPILKSGTGSLWKLTLDEAGQEAITHYRVLKTNGTLSVLAMSPKTGRTHQLRLHASYGLGCPIVGDPFYAKSGSYAMPATADAAANRPDKTSRTMQNIAALADPYSSAHYPMMLHAHTIDIPLYKSKPPIHVESPVPEGMQAMMDGIM